MPVLNVRTVNASLSTGQVHVPYWELDSGRDGPCLLVTAAQHGNEIQGAEVMRRFLAMANKDLRKGRLLLVPFANLPAVRKRRPHIISGPETPYSVKKGFNMNGTWPGNPEGTDSARLSHALFEALVGQATHNIDLHCWPRMRGTTVLLRKGHREATELARMTAVRFAEPRDWHPDVTDRPITPCTLVSWFVDTGRVGICIEMSGQYMVVEHEIRRGLRALSNCARFLDMIPGEPEGLDEPMIWIDRATQVTVTAPHSGLFGGADLLTPDPVEKNQLLGCLTSDNNLGITEIRAPIDGYLWRYGCHRQHCDVALPAQHPVADQGDTLAVIVNRET